MNDESTLERDPNAAAPQPQPQTPAPPAAPPPTPAAAHCALHVERLAAASCARCGTFVCAACAIKPEWAEAATYCKDCVVRLDTTGGGGTVPWEDKELGFFARFGRTLFEVVAKPVRFFTRLSPYGYGPVMVFQYCVMPLIVIINLAVTWIRLKSMFGGLLTTAQVSEIFTRSIIGLAVVVALMPILHFVGAGFVHLHLLLFGARRGFAATYRFTSYLYALLLVFAALQIVTMLAQMDLSPADIQAMMRGKTSGFALAVTLFTSVVGIVYTTIAAAKTHRIHPGAAFGAVMLMTLEGIALWVYVMVPMMERAAAGGRF